VSGSAEFRPNMDFFGGMQAGMENDIPLIQNHISKNESAKFHLNVAELLFKYTSSNWAKYIHTSQKPKMSWGLY
jgi:hypothetical protein